MALASLDEAGIYSASIHRHSEQGAEPEPTGGGIVIIGVPAPGQDFDEGGGGVGGGHTVAYPLRLFIDRPADCLNWQTEHHWRDLRFQEALGKIERFGFLGNRVKKQSPDSYCL